MLTKQKLLGVGVTNATTEEILQYIITSLKKEGEKYYIVTPNPEILVYATKHKDFRTILNNARLALSDGMGVIWAGKFLGKPFAERVTGTDLLQSLCKEVSEKPIRVGFLGGRDQVAEKTAECLALRYSKLKVVFVGEEWPGNESVLSSKYQVLNMKGKINKDHIHNTKYILHNTIDVLFVAFGFPKQEEWMSKNLPNIPVKVAIGVGGAFDYVSGKIPRSPVWIQNLGLEWLYRLVQQPWRIKRQLALLEFVYLVLREKFLPNSDI